MRLVICLMVAMCMIGCVTVPSTLDADGNVDSELVRLAETAEKRNSSLMKALLVGAVIGLAAAVISSSGSSDAAPAKLECFFVIGPNGSTQFCN